MKNTILLFLFLSFIFQLKAQDLHITTGIKNNATGTGGYVKIGTGGNSSFLTLDRNSIEVNAGLFGNSDLNLNRLGGNINTGHLWIGDNDPLDAIKNSTKVIIQQPANMHALALENDDNDNKWSFQTSGDYLNLFYNGNMRGRFLTSGQYSTVSDRRLKTNIKPLKKGTLKKLMRMTPASYRYTDARNSSPKAHGYIAQDLQKLFPKVVGKMGGQQDYHGIAYSLVNVVAVKALQELKEELDAKKERLEELACEMADLQNQINGAQGCEE